MSHRRNWIAVIVVILGLVMFVPAAQAQRQEVDKVACGSSTYNVVHFSPEAAIYSLDAKGISRSLIENKLLDNWTWHAVAVVKGMAGQWSWNGFYKEMAPDGDFIFFELSGDSQSGATAKPIYGTGKWKGVKGELKGKQITAGKPIVQGTNQACEKWVGWIELPK
jgi:hypothetical protein